MVWFWLRSGGLRLILYDKLPDSLTSLTPLIAYSLIAALDGVQNQVLIRLLDKVLNYLKYFAFTLKYL